MGGTAAAEGNVRFLPAAAGAILPERQRRKTAHLPAFGGGEFPSAATQAILLEQQQGETVHGFSRPPFRCLIGTAPWKASGRPCELSHRWAWAATDTQIHP